MVSVWAPVDAVKDISTMPGVKAVFLAHVPKTHVGAVTSQGVQALHDDIVLNSGASGAGVTVGILSDSYNLVRLIQPPPTTDTALVDAQSNDVPRTKALHNEEGLIFSIDDESNYPTDEGRGMAQVVHDMAPGSPLCFATASDGEEAFAEFIYTLRIDPRCGADIIVDDTAYSDEPFSRMDLSPKPSTMW